MRDESRESDSFDSETFLVGWVVRWSETSDSRTSGFRRSLEPTAATRFAESEQATDCFAHVVSPMTATKFAETQFAGTGIVQLVVNDRELELAGQATIKDLLHYLEVTVRHVAVEVNGKLIPRAEHESHQLQAGDRVEVVTLVGGG